jgi:hypothetical protein
VRRETVTIPPSLHSDVMSLLHETHPGMTRMKSLARGYFWWPKMDAQLELLVTDCGTCQALQSAMSDDQ